ncbi:uncharacterized protein [Periplaneta americana]|uniref:uncharacterized protein n=1 Tax=Periplaneta americana TaxID=6978 RepID=UPI0037E87946
MNNEDCCCESDIPAWLDNEFLENALKFGEENPGIRVTWSEVKPATIAGDNYGSDMYRAKVKIQEEEKSIIIKASKPSSKGEMANMLTKSNVFEQEINTFTTVLPAVEQLLKKIYKENFSPIAAKYLYSSADKEKIAIVLEDLKVQGFKLAERDLGLDLKHCLLVMRKIALYHATSIVLFNENPETFKPFMANFFSSGEIESLRPFFCSVLKGCAENVEIFPDKKNRIAEKLNKMSDKTLDEWVCALQRDDRGLNVLCHGDLWANNMMFRYSEDTDEVEEVRFVDFQLGLWTSPAIDLQYFLNSSASPELLEHPEVLIQEYYDYFCKTLCLLGHKHLQPTLKQINEELEKKGLFGALSAISVRTVSLSDRSNITDLNEVISQKRTMHLTEAYKDSMKKLLPLYEERGWL